MEEDKFLEVIMNQGNQLEKIIQCNEYTQKFGLILSEQDAQELAQYHKKSLKEQERVEFGEGILKKLIFEFCDSPYIYQDNYVETMEELQDIFYLYKNESLDDCTDDELVDYMKKEFNGECQGSLEYLADTSLEEFARNIRGNTRGFMHREDEDY